MLNWLSRPEEVRQPLRLGDQQIAEVFGRLVEPEIGPRDAERRTHPAVAESDRRGDPGQSLLELAVGLGRCYGGEARLRADEL